jgi:hypothetical protein
MTCPSEPNNKKYAFLRQLTIDKLLELLSVAPIPASSPEDEAYVDALEEAILEKENKNPTGFLPDVNQQWAEFQKHYDVTEENPLSDIETEIEDASFADQEHVSPGIPEKHSDRFHRIWRTALVAAALAACLFGCMIVAQAVGTDVFGTIARWTESTFSFGTVRSESAKDEAPDKGGDIQSGTSAGELEYSSLQEALDANHVTEVTAPTWIPDGYTLNLVDVTHLDNPEWSLIYAEYVNGADTLQMTITSYAGEPSAQVEKIDVSPETFEIDGISFYLIRNTENYAVAWCTDHYEYYICGGMNQKDNLKKMAYSIYN